MQLIQVQATLRCGGHEAVCQKIPFLGGVLHGTLEHLISQYAPQVLSSKLGVLERSGHALKRYRLLPPEYGHFQSLDLTTPHYSLTFGLLLYGLDADEAHIVAQVLEQHWRLLTLGGHRDSVVDVTMAILPIDLLSQRSAHPTDTVTLTFQSPFQLKAIYANPNQATPSPSLLSIVRSIKNKALEVAPEAALTLGCHKSFEQQTDAWIEAEEAIRPVLANTPNLEKISWRYGSCSKSRKLHFSGVMGTMEFKANLPDEIYTLLQWGAWLGVGEKSTFGQGMYLLDH